MFTPAGIPAYGRADYGNGCCDGFAPNFPLILIKRSGCILNFHSNFMPFAQYCQVQRLLSVILYTPWVKMKLQSMLISL